MSTPDRLGNCTLWVVLDSGQDGIASILVKRGADTDCWGSDLVIVSKHFYVG